MDPRHLVHGMHSFASSPELKTLLGQAELASTYDLDFGLTLQAILRRLDDLSEAAHLSSEGQEKLYQRLQQTQREVLDAFDEREWNHTPGLLSVVPVDRKAFDPRVLYECKFRLRFYCEAEDFPHPCDAVWEFEQPREWWAKTRPLLSAGLKLFVLVATPVLAGLPMALDAESLKVMKDDIAGMKDLVGALPTLEAPAGQTNHSDIGAKADAVDHDNRMARAELSRLMEALDPDSYRARQYGELRRITLSNHSFRWLCKCHADQALAR